MSIATLARKSRAQRGASTRAGWTLATTKSGNCPGSCGGGAPAKQQSFRRLMKNKQQGGGPNPGGTNNDASGGDCCFTTWKKTSDPKGNQSIGYYLWRKKQLMHNCLQPVFPGCGCTKRCARTQTIYFEHVDHDEENPIKTGKPWTQMIPPTGIQGKLMLWNETDKYAIFQFDDCSTGFIGGVPFGSISNHPDSNQGSHFIYQGWHAPVDAWENIGRHCSPCSGCNCNKSMGSTACCVVHKTMLPLSNSENIMRLIEDRTCLEIEKPDPRNPNIC